MPKVPVLHSWDLDTEQAAELQLALAARVDTTRPLAQVRTVAGPRCVIFGAGGLGRWWSRAPVRRRSWNGSGVVTEGRFPLRSRPVQLSRSTGPHPGLRGSRRAARRPVAGRAGDRSSPRDRPGQPRGIMAGHLHHRLRHKSRLFGEHDEPGPARGDWRPLTFEGRTLGAVLRTRDRIKPVYVSVGYLCDLPSAIRVVLDNAPKHRLPIPARLAHHYVNELRRRAAEP